MSMRAGSSQLRPLGTSARLMNGVISFGVGQNVSQCSSIVVLTPTARLAQRRRADG